jgi:hypothetical protein
LPALVEHLSAASIEVRAGEPLDGIDHVYVDDPFGNRIELLERQAGQPRRTAAASRQ